jgi:hypothetical protein
MPRKLRPSVDFTQQRFMQISESHCGPAVIQMLLSNIGIEVTQEAVAEAGGATSLIELNGMRVDQMAQAVARLAPRMLFFYKDHSSIEDLVRIVRDYRYPVGVEWQGLFEDEEEDEDDEEEETLPSATGEGTLPDSESEDEDYGHYSLVVQAYRRRRQLIIADPYKDYFSQTRVFDFSTFEERWYDYNEIPDPVTGEPVLVKDERMLFVVVRPNVYFPIRLGMRAY